MRDAQLARHHGGVQGASAAVGEQIGKGTGVQASIGGHAFDRVRHGRRSDAQNARRGLGGGHAQRLGNVALHGALGCGQIELHLAAQKMRWVDAPQQHIGVGHGGG